MSTYNMKEICYEDFSIYLPDSISIKTLNNNSAPRFSIMMCTYNDASLLDIAIDSVLSQDFDDWELLILDNSDKSMEPWQMIEKAMKLDQRIKGMKSSKNIGWAKGASICLEYISGDYTTFLSADDLLFPGSFQHLNKIIATEHPDVIFVGNGYTVLNPNGQLECLYYACPDFHIYESENRSDRIINILSTVYYNSMFHYSKVSFLKKHNIDFYDPYPIDCGSMTQAMAVADKVVTLNQIIYLLTMNTSQTRGASDKEAYKIFTSQWKSIRPVFQNENYTNKENIRYCSQRILLNLIFCVGNLCAGRYRDSYMNHIMPNSLEIIQCLEMALKEQAILDMFSIAKIDSFELLLEHIANFRDFYNENTEKIIQDSWLYKLLLLSLFHEKQTKDNKLELISDFILNPENSTCLGIYYFQKLLPGCQNNISSELEAKI